jgi:hypothetical protein
VGEEDAEGQGMGYRGLAPTDDEAEGNALKTHVLEVERGEDGELVGRFVPTDDDTEGQGALWGGLGQTEDDTEGQGARFGGLGRTDDDAEGQALRPGPDKLGPIIPAIDEEEDAEGHRMTGSPRPPVD